MSTAIEDLSQELEKLQLEAYAEACEPDDTNLTTIGLSAFFGLTTPT